MVTFNVELGPANAGRPSTLSEFGIRDYFRRDGTYQLVQQDPLPDEEICGSLDVPRTIS